MRAFLIIPMLLLIPVVSASAKSAASPGKPPQIEQRSETEGIAPASALPAASMNGITRAAAEAGVRTCLERIEQVSNFITNNTQSKFVMFLPAADVAQQFTSASIESQIPNLGVAYASMTAVPSAGSCDALYETIVYWEKSCTAVAQKEFAAAKPLGVVQQKISVLDGGSTVRIFLMPAGSQGCVSIKKEVLY